jgi:hypothetical protein
VTDKTKKLLERVINLGTRVSWLNGRAEFGKDGYEELRGVVKEAMECLKPSTITVKFLKPVTGGPITYAPIYQQTKLEKQALEASRELPGQYDSSGKSGYHLNFNQHGAFVGTEPMSTWCGYVASDIVAAATLLYSYPVGYYKFEWADGRMWNNRETHNQWRVLEEVDEKDMRVRAGLRRPDEVDYRKLG